jgi:hypothetical protein
VAKHLGEVENRIQERPALPQGQLLAARGQLSNETTGRDFEIAMMI